MYSIVDYGRFFNDPVRIRAYVEALRQSVTPDCTVADIGAGTGIFALLACRFGARRVYAIEPGDSIEVARLLARDNGFEDRIIFFREDSQGVQLPEPVDVMISDLRGALPPLDSHLTAIIDARKRLLAPAGVQIPQKDLLWGAVVEAPEIYRHQTAHCYGETFGFDFSRTRDLVTNVWRKNRFDSGQLLAEPQRWFELDYTKQESPDVQGRLHWAVRRPGQGHGLALWFDTILVEGIGFSNAPGEPETMYQNGFFPWPEPVPVQEGDQIEAEVEARLVNDRYLWNWNTEIRDRESNVRSRFRQSTFFGTVLGKDLLNKTAAEFVPSLNEKGLICRLVLERMEVGIPLEEIARELARRFPERFADWRDALTRVGELSVRYS